MYCVLLLAMCAFSAPPSPDWSLRHVDLRITVDPASRRIDGLARITVSANEGARQLALDLADSMTVDSARVVAPARLAATQGMRGAGSIGFALPGQPAGTRVEIAIWYHGRPARSAVGFGTTQPATRGASYGMPRTAQQ